MKRLWLRALAWLGLSWLFLVSLVYLAPVEWLVLQARSGVLQSSLPAPARQVLQQLEWQKLEGSLGRGRVVQPVVSGQQLQALHWSINPFSLLLARPVVTLVLESRQPWQLKVYPLGMTGLRLELQAGDLAAAKGSNPLPWQFDGHFSGSLQLDVGFQAGQIQCLHLQGELNGPVQLLQPLPLMLGQVHLQVSCRDRGHLHWLLTADHPSMHRVRVDGQLQEDRWQFQARAEVAEQAELTSILQLLNWRRQESIMQGEMAPGLVYQGRGGGLL